MVTALELTRAIYGALRLARFDRDGMQCFDDTVEAFWKSFNAALVVAPAAAIYLLIGHLHTETGAGPFRIVVVETIAYIVGWVAYPLAMFHLTNAIGRRDRYIRYIVAYNWSHVVQMALQLFGILLGLLGIVSGVSASVVSFAILAAILVYSWYIAKVALNVLSGGAALIVLFDLVLKMFIWRIAFGLETTGV